MRERLGQILKLVCFALAAVLLYQLVQTARRVNPLGNVVIPALPRLASDTNAPGTNAAVKAVKEMGSNLVASAGEKTGTNLGARTSLTASLAKEELAGKGAGAPRASGTNAPGSTNAPALKPASPPVPSMMRGGGSGGGKPADLPPEIKARVDRIYESELFGMIMRPQPMALQGIMGNSAILRTPSGQTGLVKEGDSLGELKLLRIGINRVLVEQDGKKSELTIFEGFGGESLMPKDKENSK